MAVRFCLPQLFAIKFQNDKSIWNGNAGWVNDGSSNRGRLDLPLNNAIDYALRLTGKRENKPNACEDNLRSFSEAGGGIEVHRPLPSGAKARSTISASTARLKSCPFKAADLARARF